MWNSMPQQVSYFLWSHYYTTGMKAGVYIRMDMLMCLTLTLLDFCHKTIPSD